MSTVTTGLRKKQSRIIAGKSKLSCNHCKGKGKITLGKIETIKNGSLDLLNDCENCLGSGTIHVSFRKIKNKSKVDML